MTSYLIKKYTGFNKIFAETRARRRKYVAVFSSIKFLPNVPIFREFFNILAAQIDRHYESRLGHIFLIRGNFH